MALNPGSRLGPYQIQSPLGAGGQGEVYRARDGRLDREVAIKILPEHLSTDGGALARFEREAKAVAALSHPNILAIHDFGREAGIAYAVMELLEGETLRNKIQIGSIPTRKAVDYASQIARGLGAAHGRGVSHRDLKPENLFVTKDGRIKILDFGLALHETPIASGESHSPTAARLTEPGAPLGTVGYMSPEQVRGRAADSKSDIFAFGCVLYEMLAGRRAFQRETAAETMTAILKEDPPSLSETNALVAPALERILGRCLEKDPDERFHSADDLAFALEAVSSSAGPVAAISTRSTRNRSRLIFGITGGLALAAVSFLAGRLAQAPPPQPSFRQLTFERGTIYSARFAPDGNTIVYSAAWGDKPAEIYTTRVDLPEYRSLGISNARLFSLSPAGEMALSLRAEPTTWYGTRGTLARAPIGGAPREVLESVREAEWSPDGSQLAVVRSHGGFRRLEFPPEKVLYETVGYVSDARFSPRGDLIAFLDHPVNGDNRGSVAMIDLSGRLTVLSQGWFVVEGLAWSRDGSEIWFTAQKKAGESAALYAVTINGNERLVLRTPGNARLLDVDSLGRVLLSREEYRDEAVGVAPREDRVRDLTYRSFSFASAISRDGKTVLLSYEGAGASPNYDLYLRGTDGSQPVHLGSGAGMALSPDGKWVASLLFGPPPEIVLFPTGPGEPRQIRQQGFSSFSTLDFHPDGQRLVFVAHPPGKGPGVFVQNIEGEAPPRELSPGYDYSVLSPDGNSVAAREVDGRWWVIPVDEGQRQLATGVLPEEWVAGWSADGLALYVYRHDRVTKVYRVHLDDGARELWKEVAPIDPTGTQTALVLVAPEVNAWVLYSRRLLSELYLVEGLK